VLGLDRARKYGRKLGRPNVIVDREKVRHHEKKGKSLRSIAEALGFGKDTVNAVLKPA